MERTSEFHACGRALKSGIALELRQPLRTDRYHAATKKVISETDFVSLLMEKTAHLDPDDADEYDQIKLIDEGLQAKFIERFTDDFTYQEAYKTYTRSLRDVNDDGPSLFTELLSTMNLPTKNKVKASPEYKEADDNQDYMKLYQIQTKIFNRQGTFSKTAARARYSAHSMLSSPDMTLEQYVIEFREIIELYRELLIPIDPEGDVVHFLMHLRKEPGIEGYDMKIQSLLATVPLPDLDDCVSALYEQLQLAEIQAAATKPRAQAKGTRADPAVLKSTTEDREPGKTVRFQPVCFTCGKEGHKKGDCKHKGEVTCTTCKEKGHCAKAHDLAVKVRKSYERRRRDDKAESKQPKKVSTGAFSTAKAGDDWDEDEATASHCTFTFYTSNCNSDDDEPDPVGSDTSPTLPPTVVPTLKVAPIKDTVISEP
jgi:hypothetical protein